MSGGRPADVVVCGSGVAGLATACALGRLGLDVLLLEKSRRRPSVAKGEVLQPGSLDILAGWGVLPAIEARQAVRLDRLVARTATGDELLAMDFGVLGAGPRWMLAHEYPTILDCFAESLGETVRVRTGVRAAELLRGDDGRVTGVRAVEGGRTEDIRAGLVVAADGMSSRLRRLAGMSATPVAYDHRLLSFELSAEPEAPAEVSAYVTGRGLAMAYALPGRRTRVYVQVQGDELRGAGPDRLRQWCDELVRQVPALRPLAPAIAGSLDRRQLLPVWRYWARSLVRPGIVLVGEAAHSVHPLAAQGMNTAIGDAHALAARLAGTDFGKPSDVDECLRDYESHRLGRIRDIHVMSHNAARMMTATSPGGRLLGRRLLSNTGRSRRLRHLVTYNMSGLGMTPLGPLDRLAQLGLLPARRPVVPVPPSINERVQR